MTFKKLSTIALFLISTNIFLTGCSKDDTNSVATIKGYSVSQENFEKEINIYKDLYSQLSTSELEELIEERAEDLPTIEMLYLEGKKANLTPSDDEVESTFEQIKTQIDSNDTLKERIKSYKYTDEQIKERIHKNLTVNKYSDHIINNYAISYNDVKDFYDKNKDTKYSYETLDAAHILFKTFSVNENNEQVPFSKKEKENAKAKAKAALERINKGEDFNKLAKELSEDEGSKENGGELGSFTEGVMVDEFYNGAAALKENEVSDIVESSFGYHIIKLNKKESKTYSLEGNEAAIRNDYTLNLFEEHIQSLQKKYKYNVNKNVVAKVIKKINSSSDNDKK